MIGSQRAQRRLRRVGTTVLIAVLAVGVASALGSHRGALTRSTARAADCEPGALPESVERQAAVLSEHATVECFDRPGYGLHVAAQEIREWPLADEADTGAVGFVVHRQAGGARQFAHLFLV